MLMVLKPGQKLMAMVLVAVVYVLTAKLGFLLALPPGNVTPLWPPSGIAVAAVLLFGYPMLAGIWLGSFFVNTWSLSGGTGMVVAAAIATGSTLQALAVAWVLRRFVLGTGGEGGALNLPSSTKTVVGFVLYSGLGAVMAPSIGVASLCAAGFVPWTNYGQLWWTWWLGDYAGILCVAPVLLVLGLLRFKQEVAEPQLFPLSTLWFGLSLIAYFVVAHIEQRELQARQQNQLQQASNGLLLRLKESFSAAHGLRALYDSSKEVDAEEFRTFASSILAQSHGLMALEWAPRVRANERTALEATMRAAGLVEWQIVEPDADGELVRAGERAEYFPLVHIWPLGPNATVSGLDLGFEPIRRQTLEQSRRDNQLAVTRPLHLVLMPGETSADIDRVGLLIVNPVYGKDLPLETVAQRELAFLGYVLTVQRTAVLLQQTSKDLDMPELQFQLLDVTDQQSTLLALSAGAKTDLTSTELAQLPALDIPLPGRQWRLILTSAQKIPLQDQRSWWLLLAGLLLSIIITWYIDIRRRAELRLRASEHYAKQLFTATPDALLVVNRQGQIVRANAQAAQMFGYSAERLQQMTIEALLPPAVRAVHPSLRQAFSQASSNRPMAPGRNLSALCADGRELPVEVSLNPVELPDLSGRSEPAVIAAVRDVSARRAADAAIRELNATLEAKVEERTRALRLEVSKHEQTEQILAHANEELHYAHRDMQRSNEELAIRNREAELLRELTGFIESCADVDEALQSTAHYLPYLFPNCAGELYYQMRPEAKLKLVAHWVGPDQSAPVLDDGGLPESHCWALRRNRLYLVKDTSAVHCEHVAQSDRALLDYLCAPLLANGKTIGLLHLHRAKTERELHGELPVALAVSAAEQLSMMLNNLLLRENLRAQTLHDPLTELYNRRYFAEVIKQELARSQRSQTQSSLVMIDLDHFKRCNDEFGHDCGDYLLQTFADTLRAVLRGSDIVCRMGGEEFVVLLPDAGPEAAHKCITNLAQRWRATLLQCQGRTIPPQTFSAGIACYPTPFSQADPLLKAADTAMYQAKTSGRDRIVQA